MRIARGERKAVRACVRCVWGRREKEVWECEPRKEKGGSAFSDKGNIIRGREGGLTCGRVRKENHPRSIDKFFTFL